MMEEEMLLLTVKVIFQLPYQVSVHILLFLFIAFIIFYFWFFVATEKRLIILWSKCFIYLQYCFFDKIGLPLFFTWENDH